MSHVSYTELRANLVTYMDAVCDNCDALVVTRQNARSVVMVSEDEYESMLETLHLLKSPANAENLFRAIAELDAGKGIADEIVRP